MSITATNYINSINNNYPVRGQDNDSQGFRDNFNNITNALTTINSQVDFVNNYAVITTNSKSTFYGNTISDANLQNCSTEFYDNGVQSGSIIIDYSLGSYQKLELNPGVSNISVINWPVNGSQVGQLILNITPIQDTFSAVNFNGSQSTTTYVLNNSPNLFGLYHEHSFNAGVGDLLVTIINQPYTYSTSTVANQFTLVTNTVGNDNPTYFTLDIGKNLGETNAVVLSSALVNEGETTVRSGNLALVPNVITVECINFDSEIIRPGYITLGLSSGVGIQPGAKFVGNTLVESQPAVPITVTVTDSSSTYVQFPFIENFVNPQGNNIIFKNAPFNQNSSPDAAIAFPTLSTLSPNGASITQQGTAGSLGGFLGTLTNFAGSIYANANHLEITYQDPDAVNTNTFIIDTMPPVAAVSETSVADTSTNLATAYFVHSVLPFGSIIMWYGDETNVPYGWAICDGNPHPFNGQDYMVPDLRDKFIVAAGQTNYNINGNVAGTSILGNNFVNGSTSTGGTSVSGLVEHSHTLSQVNNPTISVTVTDPGHNHQILVDGSGDTDQQVVAYGVSGISAIGMKIVDNGNYAAKAYENNTGQGDALINVAKTNITAVATATGLTGLVSDTTGTIAPNTNYNNIPPFIAVYYIMKISGFGIDPRSTMNPSIVSHSVSSQYH